jgi:hypothetical protein
MKAEDGACAYPEAPYMPNIQTSKATDLTLNGPRNLPRMIMSRWPIKVQI